MRQGAWAWFACANLLGLAAYAADVPPGTKLAAKQEITITNGAEPVSLDPVKIEGRPEGTIVQELFEGLVIEDKDGKLAPGVALKWESQDAGKVWRFSLRKDAKWSDGTPVTARDFEYSFRRMVDPKNASPYAWYLGKACNVLNAVAITEGRKKPEELGVRALDEHTLQFTLEKPVAYLVATLAHGSMVPVPRKVVEQHGDKWTEPAHIVGNGPFRLAERVLNERLVLVRNPHHWANASTVITKATFLSIGNPSAAFARYRTNAVDMTSEGGVPQEQVAQIRKEMPGELTSYPLLSTYFYMFNVKKPPFDDARVRRALSLALNREAIATQIMQTGEAPAYNFTPLATAGYQHVAEKWEQASQTERETEARRLLAEAGFGPGKPLKFPLLYNTHEGHKRIALAVAAMWKKIGPVDIELQNQEWKTFLDSRNRGDFVVSRATWGADYNEPSSMLDLFHSKHGSNDGKYGNPKYDELIDKAKVTLDAQERAKLYSSAEAILAEDAPAAFVYHHANKRLIKPWVKGWGRNPRGYIQLRDVYLLVR